MRNVKSFICGLMITIIMLPMAIFGMTGGTHNAFGIIICLAFSALGIVIIYLSVGRKKISATVYQTIKEKEEFYALGKKSNYYEEQLKDSDKLFAYKELNKHYPSLYNAYCSSVLNTPVQLYKPVSTKTAAFVGTQVGGLAVGLAAAEEAERKRQAYEQNVKDVIASKLEVGSAHDKLKYCYDEMIKIIKTNETTRRDWEETIAEVQAKLKKEYKAF